MREKTDQGLPLTKRKVVYKLVDNYGSGPPHLSCPFLPLEVPRISETQLLQVNLGKKEQTLKEIMTSCYTNESLLDTHREFIPTVNSVNRPL